MEEFYVVLNQVIILFFILIVGVVAGKYKILDKTGTKKLSQVLLFIASPMMVLNSFFIEYTHERLKNIFWVICTSILMYFIAILLSKLIFKGFNDKIRPVMCFAAIFPNCGYIGLPLMKALFGDEGVFYGSFYIVVHNIFQWSFGYLMLGGKGSKSQVIKKVLSMPSIIAMYFGSIFFITGFQIPAPIMGAVSNIGNMTMPLSMLIIGGIISSSKLIEIFKDWRAYFASFIRLIVMPLVTFIISPLIGIPQLPSLIVITALAMPAAANTSIFSEMFDKDSILASKCVAISTLLSIITIPLVILIAT